MNLDAHSAEEGIDVIGDVHGCLQPLIALLHRLGYSEDGGSFSHKRRRVVFVGDLIDRGPDQVGVLQLVRSMCESGAAEVVMGNHEFNAVGYATPRPGCSGEYLRPHSEKNTAQHKAFLDEIGFGTADHIKTVAWFSTLPLWWCSDGLRVVHACWDEAAMAGLSARVLDGDGFVRSSTKGTAEYQWVEHLCKGPEVGLPDGITFTDKDGHVRRRARYRWWAPGSNTYADACEVPPSCPPLPDRRIDDPPVQPYAADIPAVFGHYWRQWPDLELTDNAACVDYSAVKGGPLVAYRWSGDDTLDPARFAASATTVEAPR